ncbi:GTPase SAR1 family protein [Variovorax boronicumulans]|uniref:GTPase SAR1 family protein n=1 Tax=Variovorax boronicumulans TaxID=436515 RepID=A0AAW8E2L6_9BURK|nr:GTPase domain-containing protein [Variovorax boronicumulans]MDP9880291.1 GTPase SAR1 family protein [Variovorax boronicumulans]MDP9925576.1 GTPase SAR1 family protein [Variovorax boronicumulans]
MENFEVFAAKKAAILQTLQELNGILDDLGAAGIDVADDLARLRSAVDSVQGDVLRIALLGAFSDGKTSVVAGWLGRLMADMKIDMDESSDRLAIYVPEGLPGKCEIVDTPGLFGDKQRSVDGQQLLYSDITRRYIAEAHLILYVVDATNPLKDSHFDVARWVLRDLRKLSSTVFVINKMDEVTDLTDATLYAEQALIKRANLESKLQRAAELTPAELEQLHIVCMAANPNGRGLSFWFGKPEHYESRSRIGELKAVTTRVLQSNVPAVLQAKTGLDVVRELAARKSAAAQRELEALAAFSAQNAESIARIEKDIEKGRTEVKRLGAAMREELTSMENRLMGRLRPLEMGELLPFLEDEIGYISATEVGFKLQLAIKGLVDKYFSQASAVTGRLNKEIDIQVAAGISFLEAVGSAATGASRQMLQGVSKLPPSVIKDGIFAARDALSSVAGITYKFKPWEASKLASSISKWAGPAGAALQVSTDLYRAYKASEHESELRKVKTDIGDGIKGVFKDIYDILGDDQKVIALLAPQLEGFQKVLNSLTQSKEKLQARTEAIQRVAIRLERLAPPEPH